MSAYSKVTLVTPVFHASDVAFARGWSAAAPGLGGWGVVFDNEMAPERVSVVPPGAEDPVFVVVRSTHDVRLQRLRAGAAAEHIASLPGLREALTMLCPLSDDALQAIHESLEEHFPRHDRGPRAR